MLNVKSDNIKNNLEEYFNKVISGETLIISTPNNEKVVLISEKEYNELLKIKRNTEYLDMLDKSIEEYENGNTITKTIEDLEDLFNA